MNEQYPLLFLNNLVEAVEYKTRGFGSQLTLPERDRQQHGERLLATFQNVWRNAEADKQRRIAVSLPVKQGTYLEFKGHIGCDLVTKSLEDSRAGIKLLNIRVEKVDDGRTQTFATVFIPNGKENFFIHKVRKYLTEIDRRSNLPKNYSLVNSIEDVKLAILESFWTDSINLIPTNKQEKFCELWLRSIAGEENDIVTEISETCDLLAIRLYNNRTLLYPERIVCLIKANREQLLELVEASPHVAEIRIAREPTGFIVNEPNNSQAEYVEYLSSRIVVHEDNVGVCILDTGVNNGHPLLSPVLSDDDRMAFDAAWGVEDDNGHGTLMGGVSTFGDLAEVIQTEGQIDLTHRLSSVKILPPTGINVPDMYGAITQQAISLAEIAAPQREHIFCCATTSPVDHKGKPTSWSAAIDSITSGQVDGDKRLFIVSAGNVRNLDEWNSYPESNLSCPVEDPAQSWNALSVGGYTEKINIGGDHTFAGHTALAPLRGLSPYSRTSSGWETKWPIKPEIVVEAGNLRRAPDGSLYENFPDLSVLTTSNDIRNNQFDVITATSAAAAKAAWMSAKIKAQYRNAWPETIKGLMIHSAEWTNSIIQQFGFDTTQKRQVLELMRVCGFGVPNLEKALYCDSSALTLVSEEYIQPFAFNNKNRPVNNDMHFYDLPWPKNELLAMGATPVKLKVTLCYFIEPGPGEIGWKDKYRYSSHGLRFDVSNINDTRDEFIKRVSIASRNADEPSPGDGGADRWLMGANNRVLGSVHSDVWEGTAADIATCNMIAVYPVLGWWRERKHLGNVEKQARYSLIVSLITPPQDIDIYLPVETIINTPIQIITS